MKISKIVVKRWLKTDSTQIVRSMKWVMMEYAYIQSLNDYILYDYIKSMGYKVLTLLLTFLSLSASAQNLTLAELQNLCKLSNWETSSQTLQRKGWEYHDSKRGDSWQYSIITFAHSKDDYYEDRASAWFTFYTYDNRVDKIHYTPPSQTVYRNIVNALSANGYKRIDNEINDDNITVTYSSPSFMLVIKTETSKHSYNNTTFETNRLYLTRKGGIYDDDNGEKIEYWYSGGVKERYTLKDGKMNGKYQSYYSDGTLESVCNYVSGKMTGTFTLYHKNGNVKYTGTMLNGKKNGLFTSYDEDGNKISEMTYKNGNIEGKFVKYNEETGKKGISGSLLNGEKHGMITEYDDDGNKIAEANYNNGVLNGKYTLYYPNGKTKETGNYLNDEYNGLITEYEYDDDGKIVLQIFSNYVDGEKDGLWETKILKDGKWCTILYSNYDHGTPNGPAKEWELNADTVVFCNYKDGKLDGKYQVKGVFMNLGNCLAVEDDNLLTLTDGEYYAGMKTGYWTFKNSMGRTTSEGRYENDLRIGEWKFYELYIGKWGFNQDSIFGADMNMQISSIENYYNGQLHGKFIKYRDKNAHEPFTDSIEYIANYRNGELHGHYEEHSADGTITNSGSYSFGEKDGQWIEIDSTDNTKWITNYTDGKYNGKREQFDTKDRKMFSFNYHNFVLSGIQTKYDSVGNKVVENVFQNGEMQSQIEYENNSKIFEFEHKANGFTYFSGSLSEYFSNNDTSCIVTNYEFYISNNNLETPFFNSFRTCNKMKHGLYEVFDNQHRKIIEGQYLDDKPTDIWKYNFYNQNLFYTENKTNSNTPWHFYTITNEPYSGKFVRTENKNGKRYNAVYKIKKALIEEIIYSDITTGKTVFKEKFKDGLKKD